MYARNESRPLVVDRDAGEDCPVWPDTGLGVLALAAACWRRCTARGAMLT